MSEIILSKRINFVQSNNSVVVTRPRHPHKELLVEKQAGIFLPSRETERNPTWAGFEVVVFPRTLKNECNNPLENP
jgi:hypothetical protein